MSPTIPPKLTFGRFIRHLRESKNWTQEELQDRADLGAGTISNIESDDTNPKQSTLAKLAHAFGLSSGALQSQYEAFVSGGPREVPPLDAPLRRATDRGLSPRVIELAERLMRLPPAARHAFEGLLMAFEEQDGEPADDDLSK